MAKFNLDDDTARELDTMGNWVLLILKLVFFLLSLAFFLGKLDGTYTCSWGVCLIPIIIWVILSAIFWLKFAYVCGKNEEYSKRK